MASFFRGRFFEGYVLESYDLEGFSVLSCLCIRQSVLP